MVFLYKTSTQENNFGAKTDFFSGTAGSVWPGPVLWITFNYVQHVYYWNIPYNLCPYNNVVYSVYQDKMNERTVRRGPVHQHYQSEDRWRTWGGPQDHHRIGPSKIWPTTSPLILIDSCRHTYYSSIVAENTNKIYLIISFYLYTGCLENIAQLEGGEFFLEWRYYIKMRQSEERASVCDYTRAVQSVQCTHLYVVWASPTKKLLDYLLI